MVSKMRGRAPRNKRVEIRLTETEFEKWDNLAEVTGRTLSDLIRNAMDMFFDVVSVREASKGDGK